MKNGAYSLVEVLIAAAIAAIGVGAATVMIAVIAAQSEASAISLRAANLQEQSVMLYRLGLTDAARQYGILPEVAGAAGAPLENTFQLTFGAPTLLVREVAIAQGGTRSITTETVSSTIVFANPVESGNVITYRTNTVRIVLPTLR